MGARRLLLGLLAGVLGCDGRPHTTPVVYELPVDLTGWVVIEFEVPSAPPLPMIGKERVIVVPRDGYLATSSRQEFGILHLRYVAVDADGRRTPLVDASLDRETGPGAATRTYPQPVVCCSESGVGSRGTGAQRKFEGFYVGRGPAGEMPIWLTGR